MPTADLRLGWAVDFMDEPFDKAEFRFWSGQGNLSLDVGGETIDYRGMNGVIGVTPPSEKSGEAVRMTVTMDASDRAVREQLRHDVGPLRIRVRWLYAGPPTTSAPIDDGITPFTDLFTTFTGVNGGNAIAYAASGNNFTNDEVTPVRFRNVGDITTAQTGTTYYAKISTIIFGGFGILAIYDNEASAQSASPNLLFPSESGNPARLQIQGSGAGMVLGRFDASSVTAPPSEWMPTGKEFIGRLSSPVLQGATYVVDVESMISDVDRGRTLDWSNDNQQKLHPGDKGMEYLSGYADGINTKWPP